MGPPVRVNQCGAIQFFPVGLFLTLDMWRPVYTRSQTSPPKHTQLGFSTIWFSQGHPPSLYQLPLVVAWVASAQKQSCP